MAIYEPEVRLSVIERELLQLLAELIIIDSPIALSNLPDNETVLSDRQAALLIELLEEFANSKKFLESSYFVEQLSKGQARPDAELKEIFLSWHRHYGRARILSSAHWYEFLNRLGLENFNGGYLAGSTFIRGRQMPYEHFRKMESLLLQQPGISSRVRSIISAVVDRYAADVNAVRKGEKEIPSGVISRLPKLIISSLKREGSSSLNSGAIPSAQVAGLMTILTDTSVLFTTRDWSVAGTMSTIAGGFAALTYR